MAQLGQDVLNQLMLKRSESGMSISRYGEPMFRTVLWLAVAIGVGIVLAQFKIEMLAGAVTGRMCQVSDMCTPADAADQGVGFMALAGMSGYLYYPVSLAIALFVPRRAWPLMLLLAFFVLMPLGLFLDLLGFGIVLFITMMFAMVALEDVVRVGLLFAAIHSALAFLLLGVLQKPAPQKGGGEGHGTDAQKTILDSKKD